MAGRSKWEKVKRCKGAIAVVNRLVDALEEDDNVKEVYSNAEFSE